MYSFSLWHWLVVILYVVCLVVPCARILRRAGLGRGWAVLAFLPLVNIAALWVFAFVRWPAVDRRD